MNDFNEQFEIALVPNEKAVIIKQLFGYDVKFPIFIKTTGELASYISKLNKYDIGIFGVTTINGKDDLVLQIDVNIDDKNGNEYSFRIKLANGKESIQKI